MNMNYDEIKDKKVVYNLKKQPIAVIEEMKVWRATRIRNGLIDTIIGMILFKEKEMEFDDEQELKHWIATQR